VFPNFKKRIKAHALYENTRAPLIFFMAIDSRHALSMAKGPFESRGLYSGGTLEVLKKHFQNERADLVCGLAYLDLL